MMRECRKFEAVDVPTLSQPQHLTKSQLEDKGSCLKDSVIEIY